MHVEWEWAPGAEILEMETGDDIEGLLADVMNYILANPFVSFEEISNALGGDFIELKNMLRDLEGTGRITSRDEFGTQYYFPILKEEAVEPQPRTVLDDFDPYSAELCIPKKKKPEAPKVEWEDFEEKIKSEAEVEWIDWEEGLNIDELFVVTKNMELIGHFRYAGGEGVDEKVLSTMLNVIQNFVNDSFSTSGMPIKELVFDDSTLHVVPGNYLNIVAISKDSDPEELVPPLKELIEEIEEINADVLKDFDGKAESLKGIQEAVKKLAIQ